MSTLYYESSLTHHGIKGQKWGVRRYQDRNGNLTPAGRKHIQVVRSKMSEDSEIPRMLDRIDKSNKLCDESNKPMSQFLDNKQLSNKYINDWVKKHPEYPDEPEYDRYEWRSAMKNGGYNLPPYKNYAKDYGIDWNKQYDDYTKARKEQLDAMDDYTSTLIDKYGTTSIGNAYSAVNHSIVLEALNLARKQKVM